MATICTVCFNILPTECTYGFRMILGTNNDYVFNHLVFVMEKFCVFCEAKIILKHYLNEYHLQRAKFVGQISAKTDQHYQIQPKFFQYFRNANSGIRHMVYKLSINFLYLPERTYKNYIPLSSVLRQRKSQSVSTFF
jgi:hypothetical protein